MDRGGISVGWGTGFSIHWVSGDRFLDPGSNKRRFSGYFHFSAIFGLNKRKFSGYFPQNRSFSRFLSK